MKIKIYYIKSVDYSIVLLGFLSL